MLIDHQKQLINFMVTTHAHNKHCCSRRNWTKMNLPACLLLLFFSCASASIAKRQLSPGACELPEFSTLLEEMEPRCRESALTFAFIDPEDYVERQEEVFASLSIMCDQSCILSVANLVVSCFPSFRDSLALACGDNGRFPCWRGPIINNGTDVAFQCYETVAGEAPCPDYCRDSINEIRDTLGCCVNNVYNTTVFGSDLADLEVANSRLWDSCNINTLNFCPFPDAFTTEASSGVARGVSVSGAVQIAALITWSLFKAVNF